MPSYQNRYARCPRPEIFLSVSYTTTHLSEALIELPGRAEEDGPLGLGGGLRLGLHKGFLKGFIWFPRVPVS